MRPHGIYCKNQNYFSCILIVNVIIYSSYFGQGCMKVIILLALCICKSIFFVYNFRMIINFVSKIFNINSANVHKRKIHPTYVLIMSFKPMTKQN